MSTIFIKMLSADYTDYADYFKTVSRTSFRKKKICVICGCFLPRKTLCLILLERMRRFFDAFGQWSLREALKIEQACISPPHGVALLYFKFPRNTSIAFRINLTRDCFPLLFCQTHPLNSALIVQGKLVP